MRAGGGGLSFPQRVPEGCAVVGAASLEGRRFSGETLRRMLEAMKPRYNGLGGGFAGYGIYPEHRDQYAFHLMYMDRDAKRAAEELLTRSLHIVDEEPIPTRSVDGIGNPPILRRYFANVPRDFSGDPGDYMLSLVMKINSEIPGAYVMSSGKNMGVFKAVGYPSDIAEFYRIDEYEGYLWIGHGRYPTNTPGWWGGAHPFNILNTSVVHNGEISSYGTNKRYLEMWGYKCTLLTDSEVVAYSLDLLVRRHKLPIELACMALSQPMWSEIREEKLAKAVRIIYSDLMLDGPFSIIVGLEYQGTPLMLALTDRIKLRPLVAAKCGSMAYIASEECAIKRICKNPDRVWSLKAGKPEIFLINLPQEDKIGLAEKGVKA